MPTAARHLISCFLVCLAGGALAVLPLLACAEPRIVIGPAGPNEEPEVVETISGLSYDQLRRLRELRQWLEERQMLREQRRRQSAAPLFAERQLLVPLGPRYAEPLRLPAFSRSPLKLPPLPDFGQPAAPAPSVQGGEVAYPAGPAVQDEAGTASEAARVTHIYPPALPGARTDWQIEYELHPER